MRKDIIEAEEGAAAADGASNTEPAAEDPSQKVDVASLAKQVEKLSTLFSKMTMREGRAESSGEWEATPEPAGAASTGGNSTTQDDWWQGRWQQGTWWSSRWQRDDYYDKPQLSHVTVPTFDGQVSGYHTYCYNVLNLKNLVARRDLKYLVPQLVSKLTGSIASDFEQMNFDSTEYMTDDGLEKYLKIIATRIGYTTIQMERDAFTEFFSKVRRHRNESMIQYLNTEEAAYRKLQKTLNQVIKKGEDEYSSDELIDRDPSTGDTRTFFGFKLPKRLRGWFLLNRASLPAREHTSLLNSAGSTSYSSVRQLMMTSYSDATIKDFDRSNSEISGRATRFGKKGQSAAMYLGDIDDDYDADGTDDDVYAANDDCDDDDYYSTTSQFDDDDDDTCAHVSNDGYFHATQEVIDEVDEQLAADDQEYANAVMTFTEARSALAKARIARGFYPVVVPADSARPSFGRSMAEPPSRRGRGAARGRGGRGAFRGRSPFYAGKNSPTGTPPPPAPGNFKRPPPGPGRGAGGGRQASSGPICYRCGKRGHISSNCPNPRIQLQKRGRSGDAATVVLDMTPFYEKWGSPGSSSDDPTQDEDEREEAYVRLCEEARGCAILDSGATKGVTSLRAADQIQCDRIAYGEPSIARVSESNRSFSFGDGHGESTRVKITQPVTAGPFSGEKIDLHVVDTPNNETPPLIGVDYLTEKKAVVDFEEGLIKFKTEKHAKWKRLPRSERGLLLVPLTEEAQQRHGMNDVCAACDDEHDVRGRCGCPCPAQ